ncbi:Lrp/AsnC family transcriptional regulator [Aurantimicrobium minutum]|uniref:Lrp/AsnC family transcriptional regulator n=1 Tax=Aurantimicrobium minutum TaxID=708131 RepID=UPI00247578C2|nr:Lrp/AsnC family transcriptional regulator [Aurantimicrobium minutum]MDH6423273.1 Lrp/AsnC family leucine-responsive transcriptional regulator [Aurantimicrobium minutum]
MDSIDKQILWELQLNGRLSNQELADRVGLSPSPCLRRVRYLEETGVISGYAARVNASAVGLSVTALVRITMNSHSAEVVTALENQIREVPRIVEAYLMSGGADYLLKVMVKDLAEFEEFIRDDVRTLPGIASIETSFAFGMTKSPTPLPLD